MNREQKLVDMMFEVAFTIHENNFFDTMNQVEVAEWVAKQLELNGFLTEPCGASWGKLI